MVQPLPSLCICDTTTEKMQKLRIVPTGPCIYIAHIQGYFVCFNNNVLGSNSPLLPNPKHGKKTKVGSCTEENGD
jgi:hypothetical protein